jgi:6-phosphogluconolactonase
MRLALKSLTALSFAALGLCAFTGGPALAKTFVYVSNAQDGNIDAYTMDKGTGALTPIGKVEAGKLVMPMTVSPNKKFLYAAVRSDPFRVITYAIDPKSGALTQKATAPLPDSMPYVSVDGTSRFLFTASYGGDKIAVSPISPSGLVEAAAIQVIPTGRNAHAILADRTNKFVYVPALGANHVLQFLFDAKTGKLTPNDPAAVDARPGDGPRHLVFSRDNKYVYVLNELTGNIGQYAIDPKKGTLKEVASVASVPADSGLVPGKPQAPAGSPAAAAAKADDRPKVWAADIQLTPNGKFLYSTERTLSKIDRKSVV